MYFSLKSLYLRCLCYLFSLKTAWQLVNRKADFLQNESIRIDLHNESNRIDSNRELECLMLRGTRAPSQSASAS